MSRFRSLLALLVLLSPLLANALPQCTYYRYAACGGNLGAVQYTPWLQSVESAGSAHAGIAIGCLGTEVVTVSSNPTVTQTFAYSVASADGYPLYNASGRYMLRYRAGALGPITQEFAPITKTDDCVADPPPNCPPPLALGKAGVCVTALQKTCEGREGMSTGPLEVVGTADSPVSATTVCDTTAGTQADTAAGGGCSARVVTDLAFKGADGKWVTRFKGTFASPALECLSATLPSGTATVPSGTQTTTTRADPPECPGGQPGYVNGKKVCIPFDANTPMVSDKTSVKTEDGVDGSKTTTSTVSKTSCAAGNCTTRDVVTVVVTGPGGSVTSSTTAGTVGQSLTKGDYCAQKPGSPECKGGAGGSFGGECSTGFTCDGDAVLCATAKAANAQVCLLSKASDESALYETSKSGTSTGITNVNVGISSASFDASNALGTGGACIADMTTTIAGQVLTLPFSNVCPYLQHLGTLLLALSWLTAISIVGRGVS